MAEIISKVSEKIKNAANVTAKKTKTAASIAKLTLQIFTFAFKNIFRHQKSSFQSDICFLTFLSCVRIE